MGRQADLSTLRPRPPADTLSRTRASHTNQMLSFENTMRQTNIPSFVISIPHTLRSFRSKGFSP